MRPALFPPASLLIVPLTFSLLRSFLLLPVDVGGPSSPELFALSVREVLEIVREFIREAFPHPSASSSAKERR